MAAKAAEGHMSIFINFEETPEIGGRAGERVATQMYEVLNRSVRNSNSVSALQLLEKRQHPEYWRPCAEEPKPRCADKTSAEVAQ